MKPKLDPIEEAFRQIHRERCRVWRANNPEKSRAASRKWNAAHPDDKRLAVRMWKFFNREKYLEGQRKWYRENPNYQREYRAKKAAGQGKAPAPSRTKPGLRQEGCVPVAATSGSKSMSSLLDKQGAA